MLSSLGFKGLADGQAHWCAYDNDVIYYRMGIGQVISSHEYEAWNLVFFPPLYEDIEF